MATYCRICGALLAFKRTKNDHWMPCDATTGEPHFCGKDKKNHKSGLQCCPKCGRPVFISQGKTFDYSELAVHVCKKADITRYGKYVEKQKKAALQKKRQLANSEGGQLSGSNRIRKPRGRLNKSGLLNAGTKQKSK